jgi:hypothetical protein
MEGGLSRRLRVQLAISQWSSIDLVPMTFGAWAPHLTHPQSLVDFVGGGQRFSFSQAPVILGPDESIIAKVQNLFGEKTRPWSLVFNGWRLREDGSKQPEQLAGIYQDSLADGASDVMDSSDLYNDGETDLYLHEMILCSAPPNGGKDSQFGKKAAWRINPATGVQWMDRPEMIPEGNICPFNRPGFDPGGAGTFDAGPRAYAFPSNTVLRRRQRVLIRVENLSDVPQVADFALHGPLEVR